jgi:hypothetical protein
MPDTKPENLPEALPADTGGGESAKPVRSPVRGKIAFKDFLPRQEGSEPALLGLVQSPVYADLEDAVMRANKWIEKTGAQVLTVETVLLPNVRETDQSAVTTNRHDFMDSWRQFIRVWYLEP